MEEKHMSNRKKLLIIFAVIVVITPILIIYNNIQVNAVKRNKLILDGVITECDEQYRGGGHVIVIYKFNYLNNEYSSSEVYTDLALGDCETYLENKKCKIILNKKHPHNNSILLTPDDFERYDIPFPDSLKWVTKVFK